MICNKDPGYIIPMRRQSLSRKTNHQVSEDINCPSFLQLYLSDICF